MLKYFPLKQMHFIRTEELRDDMPRTMAAAPRFLGVDDAISPTSADLMVGNYSDSMSLSDRAYLRSFHAVDTAELERFLGWDLSAWQASPA
jgi:hypothetical protein